MNDERGFGTEFVRLAPLAQEWRSKPRQLDVRACGVGERAKNIEDGALTDFLARTDGVFHGGVKFGREHKSDADLLNGLGDTFRREVEIDAEGGENIRAATLRGCGAVAVLGNFAPRASENERGGGGDVEGVRAVAACADDVVDGVCN